MKFKIAVGAAILSVIGLGVSSAAIPDSTTGVITACRSSIGQLRVIDKQAGASCTVYGETEMHWNQTGPAGATGPQGPAGVAGSAGVSGYEVVELELEAGLYGGMSDQYQVLCPTGKKALGGGYWVGQAGTNPATQTFNTRPIEATTFDYWNGSGYRIWLANNPFANVDGGLQFFVIRLTVTCAYVS